VRPRVGVTAALAVLGGLVTGFRRPVTLTGAIVRFHGEPISLRSVCVFVTGHGRCGL
jgi:hypothetical protein